MKIKINLALSSSEVNLTDFPVLMVLKKLQISK